MNLTEAYKKTQELNETDLVPKGWYGFAQPIGWSQVVLELHEKILAKYPDYKVHQVKEKFAGLRYYCDTYNPEVQEWIREAEERCDTMCQLCGAPAVVRERGHWYTKLCDTHHEMDHDQLSAEYTRLEGLTQG